MSEPQLAFIIPVLCEEGGIAQLLRNLREKFPHADLIVVDGGSHDRTVQKAMPLCDQLLLGRAGRAAQMNLGASVATADYLFFLHADSLPGISAINLETVLDTAPAWGFSRVQLSGSGWRFRVIEWFMNGRSQLTGVATGDQMLFIRSSLFRDCGGFDDIPLMEDVALCKRLRRRCKPRILQQPVLTSSRRWEQAGVLRTVLRMWLLRLAYYFGVSPQRLWRFYYG